MSNKENDDFTEGIDIYEMKIELSTYLDLEHVLPSPYPKVEETIKEMNAMLHPIKLKYLKYLEDKYKIKFRRPKWWK